MNSKICSFFIKDADNTDDPDVRKRYGLLAGIVGVVSNFALFLVKIIAGIVSGSIALIGDGINNLTDASSSVITLVGFKLAALPEDEEHPYGHARIEYIAGIIVSVLIVVVGIELGRTSFDKIRHPEEVVVNATVIAIILISIAVKCWQATFNVYAGKKINSLTLVATAADSRNDVITTSVVLISLLVGHFTGVKIDGFMGLAVAIFIVLSGIGLIKETISPLLGEKPDPALVEEIRKFTTSFPEVLGIHDLVVHNYGPGKIFASIHIEVDAKSDFMECHDLIDNIERQLSKKLGIVMTAHMDPVITDDPIVNELKKNAEKIADSLEGVTDLHDLRIVDGPSHTNVIFDLVVTPSCPYTHQEIIDTFQAYADKLDKNYFVVINFDGQYSNLN